MSFIKRKLLFFGTSSAVLFTCLSLYILLTSPLGNVINLIFFFVLLLAFFISTGFFFTTLRYGAVEAKNKNRIYIFSVLALIAVMFRSAQSLNMADLFIMFLIAFGLLFYSSRRFSS
jgi:hypothetical protein